MESCEVSSHKFGKVAISEPPQYLYQKQITKMRLSLFAFLLGSASAFSPAFPHILATTLLKNSNTHVEQGFTADSGMNVDSLPLYIHNLTADNFDESLEIFEAIFTNECVGETCEDYIGQLEEKAKTIGKVLPPGFCAKHH